MPKTPPSPTPSRPKTAALAAYMKKRAAFEKVPWELEIDLLEGHFKKGIRSFFGVRLGEDGALLLDVQQPEFFRRYKAEQAERN